MSLKTTIGKLFGSSPGSTKQRGAHAKPGRASGPGRAAAVLAVGAVAVAGISTMIVPGAVAAPEVANPASQNWQYTGDQSLMLGSEVNYGQNINGFCTGDTQSGPYTTGGPTYVYPGSQTVTAGQAYNPNPATAEGNIAGQVIPAENTGAATWIVNTQAEPSRSDATTAMTAHYALTMLSVRGPFAPQTSVSQSVKDAAAALITQAQSQAGPYSVELDWTLADTTGKSGTLTGVGVKAGNGSFLAGYPVTVAAPANIVFTATGTNTWTGTSSASAIELAWTATGGGAAHFTSTVTGLPGDTIVVLESTVAQDIFTPGPSTSATGETDPFTVLWDFQPVLTSQVTSHYFSKGQPMTDDWTATAEGGSEWIYAPSGDGVAVDATGYWVGPFATPQTFVAGGTGKVPADVIPAGAPIAGTDTVTFTGAGTITAGTNVIAPASGIYYVVAGFEKANMSAEAQQYIRDSFTDGFAEPTESAVVRSAGTISTERVTEFLTEGEQTFLEDDVTFTLNEGDSWPVDLDGTRGTFTATGTVYYEQLLAHPETPADQPAPGTAAGTATVTFTEEGTQRVRFELTNGGAAGFYSFQFDAAQTNLFEAFKTPSWELVETTSIRRQITHYSEVKEINVNRGGNAIDTIVLGGFPNNQGQWAGIQGWAADQADADVTVYGPIPLGQTITETTAPEGTPVLWKGTITAGNLTSQVGWDEEIVPTQDGQYVFVTSFAGDSRTAPFTSAFNDKRERFMVDSGTPATPSVTTRAMPSAPTGSYATDEALVLNVPAGQTLYLNWDAYYDTTTPRDANGECVAPSAETVAALLAAGPDVTVGPIEVTEDGGYTSPQIPTGEVDSCIRWVESLSTNPDGSNPDDEGRPDMPGETTKVTKPERPVDISTTIQHDGNQTTGPVVGDNLWDLVKNEAEGGAQEGDTTVVKLYRHTDPANPQCVASEVVWTSEPIVWKEGETERTTPNKFPTTVNGTYVMVEETTREGSVISRGDCTDRDETITVKDAAQATGAAAASGGLASTGAGVAGLAGAAAAIAAAGAALVVARKRRAGAID